MSESKAKPESVENSIKEPKNDAEKTLNCDSEPKDTKESAPDVDEPENSAEDNSVMESSVNETVEDDDSDSDESLPPGLLERPVEILDRKRARKKITRFTYDEDKASPAAEKRNAVEIPKGIGIPLKDHPRVEYQLQRNTVDDLKIIHKFLYGVPGSNHQVKKNIREFCGFVLDKDSPQYEKKEDILGRFTVDNLKWTLMVLDVSAKGKKEDLMDTLMEWSLCPKPQDKPVPGKKEKKTAVDAKKKKSKAKAKRSAKKMDNPSDSGTPAKKSKKKASDKTAKIKLKSPKSKSKTEVNDDQSDDEPLVKKKSPPSNSEIKKYVENLLKDADLEILTMKVVFQRVYEKYPDFDLSDRKPFIKETVKKIIS